MAKASISGIIALILMTALACTRSTGNNHRDTGRTTVNADIAAAHRSAMSVDSRDRPCINLNTASANELMLLPGIGPGFAKKIIDYRDTHGPLERPQDIIIIDGFGERRYHKIEPYVCAE